MPKAAFSGLFFRLMLGQLQETSPSGVGISRWAALFWCNLSTDGGASVFEKLSFSKEF
jgi:hypothetical protein